MYDVKPLAGNGNGHPSYRTPFLFTNRPLTEGYLPEDPTIVDKANEKRRKEFLSLKDYSRQFRAQYTGAVIDLAEWANARKEKEVTIDAELSGLLKDSYENVTSLRRVLDTDKKGVYEILHSDQALYSRIQKNREQPVPLDTKNISQIVNSIDTEEGRRVFFKSKSNSYFGISEATKLAEQLYTKRVFDELGQDKKLAAYALGVSVRTIENKLKEYEESVAKKTIIPFEEWKEQIRPNMVMISYYKEKEQSERGSLTNAQSSDPPKQRFNDDEALLRIIPKPKKGQSIVHLNRRLREQGAKKAPSQPDLEELAA